MAKLLSVPQSVYNTTVLATLPVDMHLMICDHLQKDLSSLLAYMHCFPLHIANTIIHVLRIGFNALRAHICKKNCYNQYAHFLLFADPFADEYRDKLKWNENITFWLPRREFYVIDDEDAMKNFPAVNMTRIIVEHYFHVTHLHSDIFNNVVVLTLRKVNVSHLMLNQLPHLVTVTLDHVTDMYWRIFHKCRNLNTVRVRACAITKHHFYITKFNDMRSIRNLYISQCNINNWFFENMSYIRMLYLRECDSLTYLYLQPCKSLTHVFVSKCQNITPQCQEILQRVNIKVTFIGFFE